MHGSIYITTQITGRKSIKLNCWKPKASLAVLKNMQLDYPAHQAVLALETRPLACSTSWCLIFVAIRGICIAYRALRFYCSILIAFIPYFELVLTSLMDLVEEFQCFVVRLNLPNRREGHTTKNQQRWNFGHIFARLKLISCDSSWSRYPWRVRTTTLLHVANSAFEVLTFVQFHQGLAW